MERHPIIMYWKNKCCENGYTAKSNLHVQCYPIKIPMTFFPEFENSMLKFIQKSKRLQIVKVILSRMSNAGGITISEFKL
jgi:hypothetical protein